MWVQFNDASETGKNWNREKNPDHPFSVQSGIFFIQRVIPDSFPRLITVRVWVISLHDPT